MASGVQVSDTVKETFKNLKMHKSASKCVAMKILSKKEIVVDEDYQGVSKWDDLLELLPKDDARYIVFDYKYRPDGRDVDSEKLIFMFWCPESVSVKTKMLYASSVDALKNTFGQELPSFQADCKEDVDTKAILDKLKKF